MERWKLWSRHGMRNPSSSRSLITLMLALSNPATTCVGQKTREVPLMAIPERLGGSSPGMSRLPRGEKLPEGHIRIVDLLSTCVDACQRGMAEIRRVHASYADAELPVDIKIRGDPRSALTAADLAAQGAIEQALLVAWPDLLIIGEESLACDVTSNTSKGANSICASVDAVPVNPSGNALRKDLCSKLPQDATEFIAKLEDVTIFVDPLDGTREFVEGRIQNVQSLIGVAIRGHAVAGAIGLPFAFDSSNHSSPVVYALVGAGVGVQGLRTNPVQVGAASKRPLVVSGDTNDPVLSAAYDAALANGGQRALLGGTGQKILAVAEGRADVAIMNFKSNSWDTCAPEALIKAVGGELTDIFGERIVYRPEPPPPATYLNDCGVIASAPLFRETHYSICAALKKNSDALQKLLGWGLQQKADEAFEVDEVERILKVRREKNVRGT